VLVCARAALEHAAAARKAEAKTPSSFTEVIPIFSFDGGQDGSSRSGARRWVRASRTCKRSVANGGATGKIQARASTAIGRRPTRGGMGID